MHVRGGDSLITLRHTEGRPYLRLSDGQPAAALRSACQVKNTTGAGLGGPACLQLVSRVKTHFSTRKSKKVFFPLSLQDNYVVIKRIAHYFLLLFSLLKLLSEPQAHLLYVYGWVTIFRRLANKSEKATTCRAKCCENCHVTCCTNPHGFLIGERTGNCTKLAFYLQSRQIGLTPGCRISKGL